MSISNCGKDENGRYTGGKAGDQTGKEYHVIPWYSRPWKCVLRYPNEKAAKKIAEFAKAAANNDHIGYDQSQRLTFWEQVQKVKYDPAKIKVNCEADCSSSTSTVVKCVGYTLGIKELKEISPSNTTYVMRNNYKAKGFKVLTDSKYLNSDQYLLPGDILLNDDHHVAINLSTGSKVKKTEEPKKTTTTKKTWKAYNGSYPTLPKDSKGNTRALKKGDKGEEVKKLQKLLNWLNGSKIDVDGDFGSDTEKAVKTFQKSEKLVVDGKFGPNSLTRAKILRKLG